MTKKRRLEKEEAWKTDPKNPAVVFNTIVSEPLSTSRGLDKVIVIGLVLIGSIVLLTGFLTYYVESFASLLVFGFIGLMNSLVNRNKSWKIFLGCIVISLLGLAFFVILKLNGVIW